MSKLDDDGGGICYADFADLEHSGILSLVVSVGDGKACHFSVVDKTAGGFRSYSFDLSRDVDGPEIKDLGGNGKLELIVPTDLTGYLGGLYCGARWPVIYAWTGNGYSDVSSHYKDYYEKRLASLEKEIAAAEAQKEQAVEAQGDRPAASARTAAPIEQHSVNDDAKPADTDSLPVSSEPPHGASASFVLTPIKQRLKPSPVPLPLATPEPDRDGLNCTKVEADKIERFLGVSRDAGMTDAIKWADSDDPDDREFAAWIFADIATPEAIRDLQTLSRDSATASTAKILLEQAKQGPVVHTVEEDSIALDAGAPSP